MKQETLKVALCGYYPWGVKFQSELDKPYDYFGRQPIWTANGITPLFGADCINTLESKDAYDLNLSRLVLYNISCLTRPIVVKGYNGGLPFVPIEEIARKYYQTSKKFKVTENDIFYLAGSLNGESIYIMKDYKKVDHFIIEYLNRWKIDYRNLIGQKYAIDVETLNENCYAH